MTIRDRMKVSPALTWWSDMLALFDSKPVAVPAAYHQRVIAVKAALENDVSGLVNSILDFGINSALVKYNIETNNGTVNKLLNDWLDNINGSLRGKIPTGLNALAKEYYRERWKGSSLLLLRSVWENVDGYLLPTKLWFVEGESIIVEDKSPDGVRRLGEEEYGIYLGKNKKDGTQKVLTLPQKKDEEIFVQKPFESWNCLYPCPYVIKRGIFKNMKTLELLASKGEQVIANALEYMFMMKKGTEAMALSNNPDFVYSEEDLKAVKTNMKTFLDERKVSATGTPVYTTNFDTEVEHVIPEYSKILKAELYAPIERRILGGLGLVEIVEGISTTRKESVLNPKPFQSELNNGIRDFKVLLTDIIKTIVEVNKPNHRKLFGEKVEINIYNTPMKEFLDRDVRQVLRSMYDRGVLSKETFTEVVGGMEFQVEVQRRKNETKDNMDEIMHPPVIQNQESTDTPKEEQERKKLNPETPEKNPPKDKESENKSGPEAKSDKSKKKTKSKKNS